MMTLEQIVCHARNLTSLAEKAISLHADAQTYRALGKVALADLLDWEAAEWEDRARKALHPGRSEAVVTVGGDAEALRTQLLALKRRRGFGLGLA